MEVTLPTTVSYFPFSFSDLSMKNRKVIGQAAGWCLFIDSPTPLPRGVPFFIAVRWFPHRCRSSPLIFPTTLELWRARPNTNHLGSAHYCACGEPSDVLRFVSGWTRIAGRGGWV